MKRVVATTLAAISALPVLLALLLFCVRFSAFQLPFYLEEYRKYGNAQIIGVSKSDLEHITVNVIDYLKGIRPNLDMQYEVNGVSREIFNQREKEHMDDVLGLFKLSATVMYACIGGGIALIFLTVLTAHKKRKLHSLGKGYLIGAGIFALLSGALVLYISMDYTNAFVRFHEIFFNNDKWILNEDTDILIMMVPLGFFMDISMQIAMLYGAGVLVTLILAIIFMTSGRRPQDKHNKKTDADKTVKIPWGSEPSVGFKPKQQRGGTAGDGADGTSDDDGSLDPDKEDGIAKGLLNFEAIPTGDDVVFYVSRKDETPTSVENIFEAFGLSDQDDVPLMPEDAPALSKSPHIDVSPRAEATQENTTRSDIEQPRSFDLTALLSKLSRPWNDPAEKVLQGDIRSQQQNVEEPVQAPVQQRQPYQAEKNQQPVKPDWHVGTLPSWSTVQKPSSQASGGQMQASASQSTPVNPPPVWTTNPTQSWSGAISQQDNLNQSIQTPQQAPTEQPVEVMTNSDNTNSQDVTEQTNSNIAKDNAIPAWTVPPVFPSSVKPIEPSLKTAPEHEDIEGMIKHLKDLAGNVQDQL